MLDAVLAELDFEPSIVCSFPDCDDLPEWSYSCQSCHESQGLMCGSHYAHVCTRSLTLVCGRCRANGSAATLILFSPLPRGW